ncbi:MAG: DMT family transporter [Aquificaceae bacterium]|nr:DMT family transporter [Aquificaceae bacterium]MCS7307064.1 DMT family transporter [Aquificaceae bacterium]MCX8076858.1 DMT family transporter [Aquificaceae bacterium]MDW8433870.1 DMT family transporter [Aquificaceae bacterium]
MKSLVFAILASLVWGTAPVFFKLGMKGDIAPLNALVFHNLSAFLLALVFALLTGAKWDYPLKDLILIVAGGIMSGFLGLFFFFKAVREGEVSVVAPLASTSPLWASLIAFFLLNEPFSWLRFFGILLVVCGIVLISLSSGR